MTTSNPVSPGIPPDADGGGAKEMQAKREFVVFYQKHYYKVPPSCVLAEFGKSTPVGNGLDMSRIYDCKSFSEWVKAGVKARHAVLIEADVGGGQLQRGLYITFCVKNVESDDNVILRPLHKTIAQKFYDQWKKDAESAPPEKTAKFSKLLEEKPPDLKQISPVSCHWEEVTKEDEPHTLFERKKPEKQEKGEGGNPPSKKQKTGGGNAARFSADEEDESIATSALVPCGGAAGGGQQQGVNFFAATPGMVTIDRELFDKMATAYYGSR